MTKLELIREISFNVTENLSCLNDELSKYKSCNKKIIFPKKGDNKRVSEQEARFLFIQELESKGIYYSIETPTTYRYKFNEKAKKESSARIDLCIYKLINGIIFNRDLLIEFKANTKDCIKDFIKLFNEPENGILFHLLINVDKNTLTVDNDNQRGVLSHYFHGIKSLISDKTIELSKLKRNDWEITFIVASISQKFVIYKTMKKKDIFDESSLGNFFALKYKVNTKLKTIDFIDKNNWIVLKK